MRQRTGIPIIMCRPFLRTGAAFSLHILLLFEFEHVGADCCIELFIASVVWIELVVDPIDDDLVHLAYAALYMEDKPEVCRASLWDLRIPECPQGYLGDTLTAARNFGCRYVALRRPFNLIYKTSRFFTRGDRNGDIYGSLKRNNIEDEPELSLPNGASISSTHVLEIGTRFFDLEI